MPLKLSWASAFLLVAPQLLHAQTATAHAGNAMRLMQDRQFSAAALEFEASLAAQPNDDEVRIEYATCLFALEKNADARKQFEIESTRLGEKPGFSYFLGRLDLRANDFAAAIRRLQPLAANPGFPKASYYLGLAYLSTGRDKEAEVALQLAGQKNPKDPEVHYRLGRLYSIAGREQDAKREYKIYDDARESQKLVEGDGHACMDALSQMPISEARKICERLNDPTDARKLLLLGQLYAGKGAFTDALGPLQASVRLDPQSFDACQTLGLTFYSLRRYQEAVPVLEKAVSLNPQFFDALNLLAATYHNLGDDASALPILERAHQLNPSDLKLAAALERMRAARKDRSEPRP